jgi:hypothetical protein
MKGRVVSSSPSTKYFPLCIQRGTSFLFLGTKGHKLKNSIGKKNAPIGHQVV